MTSSEIRQSFLDFFAERGHTIVPSSSLLPDSPGLLFTNAGMNQFVPIFLGSRQPDVSKWAGARPARDTRAADTQKCIRAGGKHNDLEDVGFDTYHHTLFEMLGNWSFGDYFKRESLQWGWELITQRWGIPARRLFATVYAPDKSKNDPSTFDQEAADIWAGIFRSAGLDPAVHIVHGNKKDNFWMMGDTGPCGPCSEIHFNLLPEDDEAAGRRLVNAGSPRCIEIWNHVFIQFNANADGTFSPLAAKHVDTGMGFERVAGICASTGGFKDFRPEPSNYAADIFTPIFGKIAQLAGKSYGATVPKGREGLTAQEQTDVAFRVLADHARCVSCAIADGILPGNEGRNYVIRRILRRGILYGKKLGLAPDAFGELVAPVVQSLGGVFPELPQQQAIIRRVIRAEEETFGRTLDRGLQIFNERVGAAKQVPGALAFELYDTYGFPLDMTQLLAAERGLPVDTAEFEAQMERQRERGRAALKKEVVVAATEGEAAVAQPPTRFTGYHLAPGAATHAQLIDVVSAGEATYLVFDQTPFYAEMGGQVGDQGTVLLGDAAYAVVDTVKDKAGRHLHRLSADKPFARPAHPAAVLSVDLVRRRAVQRHHSATHLLHWALRKVLGTHVRQAGSLNAPDRLRFDFAHFEAVTPAQLREIEELVNDKVLANDPVQSSEVAYDQRPEGTLAFFGEKYGKVVRVVDIGGYSRELCGGTHVATAGEIGFVKVIHESAIAAGTRRVEALAGEAAYRHAAGAFAALEAAAARLGAAPAALEKRLEALLAEKAEVEKRLRSFQQKAAADEAETLAAAGKTDGALRLVRAAVATESNESLRALGAQVLAKIGEGVVVLGAAFGDKATVVAFCSPAAIQAGHQAGRIVNELSQRLGGKGGGKPDFAMGGGRDVAKLAEVLA
ncbi:MAG TPA: alanine--tRNA ligase [Opitutaceae bacterium]|jgi:alanyl-tRNA synthetase|nr:alanine--tRNA ligase [Opitutaceae bacterium]